MLSYWINILHGGVEENVCCNTFWSLFLITFCAIMKAIYHLAITDYETTKYHSVTCHVTITAICYFRMSLHSPKEHSAKDTKDKDCFFLLIKCNISLVPQHALLIGLKAIVYVTGSSRTHFHKYSCLWTECQAKQALDHWLYSTSYEEQRSQG